ncbi:MAG: hypothetical protein H8E31_09140 [Planctomycetes bacterium]|nr:hypothetical protein [Planctomycetota bacterium]
MTLSLLLLALPAAPLQLPAAQERDLVIYQVADLCEWREAAEPPEHEKEFSLEGPPEDLDGSARLVDAERFAELLREWMEPAFEAGKDQLIPLEGGNLVALLRPAQHRWLEALLERQRSSRLNLLFDVVVLTGPEHAFEERELSRTSGGPSLSPEVASKEVLTQRLEQLRAAPDFEERNHLRLVTFERQRASMAVAKSISYVKDYELVTVEPSGASLADPIIGVLKEGLWLKLNGMELTPGSISLELDFLAREVERPIPTFSTTLAGTQDPVTLALPSLMQVGFRSCMTMPEASGALFVLNGTTEGEWMAIFLFVKGIKGE